MEDIHMLTFIIPGRPIPKGRPQFNRHTGKARTPKRTVEYERYVGLCARMAMAAQGQRDPFEGGVAMKMTFLFARPQKVTAGHCLYERPGRAPLIGGGNLPDLSNIVKSVEDGLQGVVFGDDCQVCYLEVSKSYCSTTDEPGAHIEVWRVE